MSWLGSTGRDRQTTIRQRLSPRLNLGGQTRRLERAHDGPDKLTSQCRRYSTPQGPGTCRTTSLLCIGDIGFHKTFDVIPAIGNTVKSRRVYYGRCSPGTPQHFFTSVLPPQMFPPKSKPEGIRPYPEWPGSGETYVTYSVAAILKTWAGSLCILTELEVPVCTCFQTDEQAGIAQYEPHVHIRRSPVVSGVVACSASTLNPAHF